MSTPSPSMRYPGLHTQSGEGDGFASRRQMRWLFAGLAGASLLFAAEIGHYIVATDLGARDRMDINANHDPRCKPLHSNYDFVCPLPGYNSVQMTCMATGCGDRNLSLPPTTEAFRNQVEETERADKLLSLKVEAPFSAGNPEWEKAAQMLIANKDTESQPTPIAGAPQTLEEAQQAVRERSVAQLRQNAQEWLAQHEP